MLFSNPQNKKSSYIGTVWKHKHSPVLFGYTNIKNNFIKIKNKKIIFLPFKDSYIN
jgi:hypothetical protein